MDLLEEAGIPPPPPPIVTPEDRAELAGMALAQRQMFYCLAFGGGLLAGAVIAYTIGYHDEIVGFASWMLSGTGIAVALSLFNTSRLTGYKCPRCGENFFGIMDLFAGHCQYCGLPLVLHDDDGAGDSADDVRAA
jgi:DNA-directed RNA polymerase subunit RPC12/RpoP